MHHNENDDDDVAMETSSSDPFRPSARQGKDPHCSSSDGNGLAKHNDLSETSERNCPERIEIQEKNPSPIPVGQRTADIVYQFMVTTTAHGWAHVARGFNHPIKTLWLVLTLTAFTINVAHVIVLVLQFEKRPYEQVTEMDVDNVEFPSLTICNLQPVSPSTTKAMNEDPTTKLHEWNNLTRSFFQRFETNNSMHSYEFEMAYDRLRGPLGFFENIGVAEASRAGHQAHDFIVHCTFSKHLCSMENFTWFFSADFFNCFTFNGLGNVDQNENDSSPVISSTGPESGLSLTLFTENDNGRPSDYSMPYYVSQNTGNGAGVRVTVHPPKTRPNPTNLGFDVPPGYSSSIGLSVTRYKRLGDPYGECADIDKQAQRTFDRFTYSTDDCLRRCQHVLIFSKCGCLSASLPMLSTGDLELASLLLENFTRSDGVNISSLLSNASFCGELNPSRHASQLFIDVRCEAEISRKFAAADKLRSKCDCANPCEETFYHRGTSYSYWPADYTQGTFYRKYILENPKRNSMKAYESLRNYPVNELVERGLIRKNFVRLNVYVESLVVDVNRQKPSYTIYNLISDIGGTFGLWIGMSLLTWGEVIEFCIHLFIRWCKKL